MATPPPPASSLPRRPWESDIALSVFLALLVGTTVISAPLRAVGAGPVLKAVEFAVAMWLSFITITTTGYGDVLPASDLARSLAALESFVGVLYPAILISRLVSLAQGPSPADE